MGIYGKQQNAPGFKKVAAERQRWKDLKAEHLSYSWFVEVLENELKAYKEYLNSPDYWRVHFKRVWSEKAQKWINKSVNADERLYWDMCLVGNGMKDIDDYRDVIQVPSWTYESRMVLEDVLSEKKKDLIYQLYKEEKEGKNMGIEDNKPRNKTQKKVSFA